MLDELLGLELQKRVADGAAANTNISGEVAVREPLPRRNRHLDDHATDLPVGLRRRVFLLFDACGQGQGPVRFGAEHLKIAVFPRPKYPDLPSLPHALQLTCRFADAKMCFEKAARWSPAP